jgi:sugar phosphate isomerase/epimerase
VTGDRNPKPAVAVGLSTSSAFPEDTASAFRLAAELGYDGVEVMVTADRLTQDAGRLSRLATEYGVPVLSVHSPCLAISARVWGTDPIGKIDRSVDLAGELGARTVVAHPPFAWQWSAADRFPEAVAETAAATEINISIENMYPVRVLGAGVSAYRPSWNVAATGYPSYTLDISHTATAQVDAVEMAEEMGHRLTHVHAGDGTGAPRDGHLVPGRGLATCAAVLGGIASGARGARTDAGAFAGVVVLEVSTRTLTPSRRVGDLAESLAFVRRHLGQPYDDRQPPALGS